MEDEGAEHKKQADQENIVLKNQSIRLPTNDEEISHACSSSDDNNSTDEL
jgi:hypothetical protein